jgi:hypothetical protein
MGARVAWRLSALRNEQGKYCAENAKLVITATAGDGYAATPSMAGIA